VTLTVEINGAEHSVALPPADPQKPIYVAVGEPGRRSEVWRIWANKAQAGKSDVYVAARPIAGRQKCSLHETGDWRHQWIRIEDAEAFTGTRCRILDQWQRGAETADGITPALSIWVLAEDVTAVPDDNLPRNVTWLPAPDPGLALGVHITLARPDQGFFPSAAPPIGGFTLANGEVVLVFADIVPVPDEGSRWLDEMRRVWTGRAHGHFDVGEAKAPRMALFCYDEKGHRVIHDLAVYQPQDAPPTPAPAPSTAGMRNPL